METEYVKNPANLLFIGFMFIGIAAGLYFNVVAAGTLVGMGAGFVAKAIFTSVERNRRVKNEKNINTL